MGTLRINQVNSVIVSLAGDALKREFDVPGVLATITKAETTPDIREATVWISLLPDGDDTWGQVAALVPHLQRAVAAGLETRHTPRLTLRQDHGPADAARIESLLRDGR